MNKEQAKIQVELDTPLEHVLHVDNYKHKNALSMLAKTGKTHVRDILDKDGKLIALDDISNFAVSPILKKAMSFVDVKMHPNEKLSKVTPNMAMLKAANNKFTNRSGNLVTGDSPVSDLPNLREMTRMHLEKKSVGIHKVGQLLEHSVESLQQFPQFGPGKKRKDRDQQPLGRAEEVMNSLDDAVIEKWNHMQDNAFMHGEYDAAAVNPDSTFKAEDILNMDFDTFQKNFGNKGTRFSNLRRSGAKKIQQLLEKSEGELLEIPQTGELTITRLKAVLQNYGLNLQEQEASQAPETPEPDGRYPNNANTWNTAQGINDTADDYSKLIESGDFFPPAPLAILEALNSKHFGGETLSKIATVFKNKAEESHKGRLACARTPEEVNKVWTETQNKLRRLEGIFDRKTKLYNKNSLKEQKQQIDQEFQESLDSLFGKYI